MIGFQLLSAVSQLQTAKAQAKSVVQQGALDAENKAKETRIKAARVKSSFLSSGLELEGTPINAISDTFNVGIADTNQIISNANRSSRNIMSQARTQAIGTIAQSIGSGLSGMGGSTGGTMFGRIMNGGESGMIPFGARDLGTSMPWNSLPMASVTPQITLPRGY